MHSQTRYSTIETRAAPGFSHLYFILQCTLLHLRADTLSFYHISFFDNSALNKSSYHHTISFQHFINSNWIFFLFPGSIFSITYLYLNQPLSYTFIFKFYIFNKLTIKSALYIFRKTKIN